MCADGTNQSVIIRYVTSLFSSGIAYLLHSSSAAHNKNLVGALGQKQYDPVVFLLCLDTRNMIRLAAFMHGKTSDSILATSIH